LSKRLKRILGEQGEELGEARNFLYDVETWEEMEHAEEEEVNRLERELEKLTQEVDILSRAGKDENELLESAEELVSELKNRKDFQHAKEKKEELSTRKLAEGVADENQDPDKLSILLKRMFEEVEKMEENPREETLFEEVSGRATSLRHNIEEIENLREVNKNEKKELLSKLSPLEEEMKRVENALGKLNNHCKEYVGFCNSQIKSIEKLGVQEYLKASPIDSSEVSQLNQVQHNLKLFRYNVGVLRLYMMGHENIDEDKYASNEIDISSRELREKTYKKGLIPQIETFTNGLEKLRSNA
jgi:chromosome segregation ATPase